MSDEIGDDKIKVTLEAWKTAIGVQQHFNTIEMQIRNIAITVVTATIGTAALVFNQMQSASREVTERRFPTAPALIVLAGLIAWSAFYIMDRWWYHRLLQGAVKHAQAIEDEIEKTPYGAIMSLSNAIRKASPFKFLGKWPVRSDRKIDLFYGIMAVMLIVIMLIMVLAF